MTVQAQTVSEVCPRCDAPVFRQQTSAKQSCSALACERQRIAELSGSETQSKQDEHDTLTARMREACEPMLQDSAQAMGSKAEALQIAVIPYNDKPLTVLPEARRSALETHLRAIAIEGFAVDDPETYTAKYVRKTIDLPEERITDAACATCMGYCCKAGGPNWGFTDMTTVCRFRVAHPEADAEAFSAHYLGRLPETSVDDNCVFQSGTGCTLGRTERADICNSFLCRGVKRILKEHGADGTRNTAIIAQHEGTPRAIGMFDADDEILCSITPIGTSL